MTTEEFKRKLDAHDYSYEEKEGKIVVIGGTSKNIWSSTIEELPPGVVFVNEGNIWLDSLRRIPSGVVFANSGHLQLTELAGGKTFHKWEGNIEGIDSKRLLNKMVALGLFDRR
jgi:hypothetical protein